MSLQAGTRLGPYEITAQIGAGGMGEVYQARDPRLQRDVAIKVLPAALSLDPDRLRRFEQEARAAAALNHPNVLTVHEIGMHDGQPYVVSELLDGHTLRVELANGPLAARKATDYAIQISQGLAAAHDKGIVHRDLKPENLFITSDHRVKILDFGLAKLIEPAIAAAGATMMATREETTPGVILGTVSYMSPEQVRGQTVDYRSDIFSFGVVAYEMLFGQCPFKRDTPADTMSAILNAEPPAPLSAIAFPPSLDRIVRRCLHKHPGDRFQSAHDLVFALSTTVETSGSGVGVGAADSRRPRWQAPRWSLAAAGVALGILAGIVVAGFLRIGNAERPRSPLQATIPPPPGEGFWANQTMPAAISPDGTFLALVAMRNGHTQLWLRRLDASDAQPVVGTEDATNPFWSPDSRYIAFFAAGTRLKKVEVAGGTVTDICPVNGALSGAWSSRGVIVLGNLFASISRVSDAGGVIEPVAGISLADDAAGQVAPDFLPDGTHFIFLETRFANPRHPSTVWIGSLDGGAPVRLPLPPTNVHYSDGHLLFARDGDLWAQEFDTRQLAVRGSPRPIARHVEYDPTFEQAAFTASGNGILVYGGTGLGVDSELTWMNRSGQTLGTLGEPAHFMVPRLSPDDERVAVDIKDPVQGELMWTYDVARGTRLPLAREEPGARYGPVWSPDGRQIAFRRFLGKTSSVHVRPADGSGQDQQVSVGNASVVLQAWDWNNQHLIVTAVTFAQSQSWQLEVLAVDGDGKPASEIAHASSATFSPDGHWIVYSDSLDGQIYATPFPGPGARIAISSDKGGNPRWRSGQELFYVAADRTVISVDVRESPQDFRVLSSKRLFRLTLPGNVGFFDVSRDGERFLVNTRTLREQTVPLTVMTDWPAALQGSNKPLAH